MQRADADARLWLQSRASYGQQGYVTRFLAHSRGRLRQSRRLQLCGSGQASCKRKIPA